MRPAQIRVFDGLRITTDLMNHLQGALSSGFEDLREILGLGRPQTGLQVSIADDGTATIQTGTAFDQQKNRVACDTPLTLKVVFADNETTKFICLKYEQVEDTTVEGHPTMLWDSCSALVRDTLPAPADNLVTLARVVKGPDGKLQVCHAHERREYQAPESSPLVSPPDTVPLEPVPPTPPSTADTPPASDAQPLAPDAAPPAPVTTQPAPAPDVTTTGTQFRQGLIQLSSDPSAGTFLRLVLAPALRAKSATGPVDLAFTLAQSDLNPEIVPASLSTQCLISGDLTFPALATPAAATTTTDTNTPAAPAPPQPHFAFDCTSSAEATSSSAGLLQFASTSIQMRPIPAAAGTVWPASFFTAAAWLNFRSPAGPAPLTPLARRSPRMCLPVSRCWLR